MIRGMNTSPALLAALARVAATPAGGRTFESLTAPFLAVLAAAVLALEAATREGLEKRLARTLSSGASSPEEIALREAVSAWGAAADHVLLHYGPRLVERRLIEAVALALTPGMLDAPAVRVARELEAAVEAYRAATG